MTWTSPKNFKDNSIVTADDWNSVLGSDGNVNVVNKMVLTRANCNITTASFTADFLPQTTASTTKQKIRFSSSTGPQLSTFDPNIVESGNIQISPYNYSANYTPFVNNDSANNVQKLEGIPYLLFWQMNFSDSTGSLTALWNTTVYVRTTFERLYDKAVSGGNTTQKATEIVACQYNIMATVTPNVYYSNTLSASIGYVSHNTNDTYYLTVSHSASKTLRARGQVRLIVNPGII